ncbi:MAG: MBL fold metallo-hydrolase [Myxococcales bacterium]|nr:MBL fold metallo-hydrolase [Myxococcales bacterium]
MSTGFDGIDLVAVRSPTLPPATHTNAWILGVESLTVVDPASPWDDEQQRLFEHLWARAESGVPVERIFLTHHHLDHVSGAMDLKARLAKRDVHVPIVAHEQTARLVADRVEVAHHVADREVLDCGGLPFVAHHTPGHAPGHLALHQEASGAVIAGDMVAGVGTIAIDPSEGDLQQYLDSLEHLRSLAPSALMPAHGPILEHADTVLSFYVAHRNGRSDQIRAALAETGSASPLELAPTIYPELDPAFHPIAAAQILTHLKWLGDHGLVRAADGDRWCAE